jgi:hypothetical protein
MLVWRGWGILVVVLSFAALLLTQVASDAMFGEGYYAARGWPKFVGLALAAAFVWLFSRLLDARSGRVVIDKETGEQLTLRGGEHLFFVPVRVWPPLLLVAGTMTDGSVTFTISRDGREFVWTGTTTDAGRTLTGQFEGFSNDATYRRP